jgi:uncharacterized protein
MKNRVRQIFQKEKGIVIGALHFPPLPGYAGFPGIEVALRNAIADLRAFEKGGVDGVILENNYDVPHREKVDPTTTIVMAVLGEKLRAKTKLPLGVSVLWNDFQTALSLAKILNLQFIRVPVFVDTVRTKYCTIKGNPKEVVKVRKKLSAEHIALLTDIHVKHSVLLSKKSITSSAQYAIKNKSDMIIITGKWTGDSPKDDELLMVRNIIGEFPILLGSGISKDNVNDLLQYANGVIVSTSLKEGKSRKDEINIKGWDQRIDAKKVKEFVENVRYTNNL